MKGGSGSGLGLPRTGAPYRRHIVSMVAVTALAL